MAANRLPIRPVRMPADLAGQKNGQLHPGLLRTVRPYGQLHRLAADAYEALREAARPFGDQVRPIKPTSSLDTYRPLTAQERVFFARYTNEYRPNPKSIRTYNGQVWYIRNNILAPVATPGSSFHGWGLAVDIWNASGKRLEWLLEHAQHYGFSWELQSEPWHIRYVVGDKVPPAVQRWKDSHANGSDRRPN
jgi:LAS superfamily LD-carboxypeptidase LdcB